MTYRTLIQSWAYTYLCALLLPSLNAAPMEFVLDETQSKIALSGSVIGNPLTEQGLGSLNTSFYGSIVAEVGGSGIQFTGGSLLNARTNGVWKPGPKGASGSAPADYAAQASTVLGSVKGALRNLVLDLTSGVLPVTNGQFNASELLFAFPTNSTASFDYDGGFLLGASGIALSGISTNKIVGGATLTISGDVQTLTIPVDAEFKFQAIAPDDSRVRLTGKLIATRTNQPTIASIQVKNQIVTLQVQDAGPAPRLDSSTNLLQWTPRNPERTTNADSVILTLPATPPNEFYRVAK